MAAKKREIYARAAVQLRSHERPAVAESLCPGAMGLYFFLLVQARGEGSDGDVAEVSAFASWSAPTAYRKKQAEALITAGLVERRDGRLWVVKYEEHNDTSADIAAARAHARDKKREQRRPESVPRDNDGTTPVVPISSFNSLSGSGSDLGSERPTSTPRAREADPPPRSGPVSDPFTPPPDWWPQVIGTIGMTCGVDLPEGEAWLRYAGHRNNKRLPATREDAVQWLSTVMVREARDARDKARRDNARDASFKARFDKPPGLVAHEALRPPTAEDTKLFTEELKRRLASAPKPERKVGT